MSEKLFRLVATFAQGEVHQAVLQDDAGELYLVNPSLGSVLVRKTSAQVEALLRSARTAGVLRFKTSARRTQSEVEQFLGPANNQIDEKDLEL